MSAGVYPRAANCGSRGRSTVNAPCFCGDTPLWNALSGISPLSQIIVPRGWTIRKQGVTISAVFSSPGLNPIESPLTPVIVPQSRTYRRSDFGGWGFFACCAVAGGITAIPTNAATANPKYIARVNIDPPSKASFFGLCQIILFTHLTQPLRLPVADIH